MQVRSKAGVFLVALTAVVAAGWLAWRDAPVEAAVGLPAAQNEARSRLNASPRHGEWVDIKENGSAIRSWVVYPERSGKAPVVVVIHEIFGLTVWIRAVADQLAAEGFIAIAPDLLSGRGPAGGGTESVDRQGAIKLVRSLDPQEVVRRLNTVAHYGVALPAARNQYGSIGFCWGGATSFRYATEQPGLSAAVVYYGRSPQTASLGRMEPPVLGLYGGNDARVNATIPEAEAELKRSGKRFEQEIYEGAGHGFLRQQGGQAGSNLRATQQAWPRTVEFLKKHLEG